MLAAIQAPVIMMSQNRQDTKDRLRGELDYDVNRRAETEIQGLARKLNMLGEKIGDVEEAASEKKGKRNKFSHASAFPCVPVVKLFGVWISNETDSAVPRRLPADCSSGTRRR